MVVAGSQTRFPGGGGCVRGAGRVRGGTARSLARSLVAATGVAWGHSRAHEYTWRLSTPRPGFVGPYECKERLSLLVTGAKWTRIDGPFLPNAVIPTGFVYLMNKMSHRISPRLTSTPWQLLTNR